ncbi:hypothetical protein RJT34_28651 [Clitoria ternatea]|uniref:Uncharacterized protein n=1 Tax=Clitoria ternatea TaxID=43366 RepID=A0AAN9I962_CLITE
MTKLPACMYNGDSPDRMTKLPACMDNGDSPDRIRKGKQVLYDEADRKKEDSQDDTVIVVDCDGDTIIKINEPFGDDDNPKPQEPNSPDIVTVVDSDEEVDEDFQILTSGIRIQSNQHYCSQQLTPLINNTQLSVHDDFLNILIFKSIEELNEFNQDIHMESSDTMVDTVDKVSASKVQTWRRSEVPQNALDNLSKRSSYQRLSQ